MGTGDINEEDLRSQIHANNSQNAGHRRACSANRTPRELDDGVMAVAESFPAVVHCAIVNRTITGTGLGCLVFSMTTGNGRNDGVTIIKRLHMDTGTDLKGSWIFFDICHKKCLGEWKCMGAHVYSFPQRRLLCIAIAYMKEETAESQYQFWCVMIFVAKKKKVEVKPQGFMADQAGANLNGLKLTFPYVKANPQDHYEECKLHVATDVKRLGHLLPIENRAENISLWNAWLQSPTEGVADEILMRVFAHWLCFAPKSLKRLEAFAAFHQRHAGFVVDGLRPEASVGDRVMQHNTNLSETGNSRWANMDGYGASLPQALLYDIAFLANQVAQGDMEENHGYHTGRGPSFLDNERRLHLKDERAEQTREDMNLGSFMGACSKVNMSLV